ncbi:SIR2 family protein [Bacteroides eggerthii]|uniref:SIR2 family protein n=1 Tax=Bacteroides eggerthii TaxID=28111 RepID=UPI001E49D017|nr:SIR2 family protein [Bacteroides eggerthii]
MEIREAIIHALDGDAILFIGSGFSLGAINEGNKKIETATPLAHKLLAECDFEEKDFTNDLGIASRIYQSAKSEIDLIEFLRKEYTAIDVTPEQEIIAQINWQRIYTTNYDNVFELACEKNKKKIQSVTLSDRPNDFKNKSNLCIHINGDIKRLTQEKLNSEFKLTNVSYLTEDFNKSEWLTLFRSDLQTAKSIIFIGYSMQYDLDLQRIVYLTPKLIIKLFL